MRLNTTAYYSEFLRYHTLAKQQQRLCNLGWVKHSQSYVDDDLMEQVHLYDVVERKYAGFSQLIHDCFYGNTRAHPYHEKMQQVAPSHAREWITEAWTHSRAQTAFELSDWLYVFLVHRLTGSGINYALSPSGYYNTVVPEFFTCRTIEDMVKVIKRHRDVKIYTSVGYQFPAFPKVPTSMPEFKRAGDYFLCHYAPDLACELAHFLRSGGGAEKKDLRQVGEWMFAWNKKCGLNAYRFQYAAVIADICDWFPEYVNLHSPFYYGSNAVECISYLVEPLGKTKNEATLDAVMQMAMQDTGNTPYNLEDVCCDFIRWVENYVKPGGDYDHVDRDKVWSSCSIKDHPYGRQQMMLELGLVKSFNAINHHPADDFVIAQHKMSPEVYREKAWRHS